MTEPESLEGKVKIHARHDPDRLPSEVPRVILRFRLADSKDDWIKRKIRMLADKLERGSLADHEAQAVAKALRGIAAGFSAEQIFGLGNARGGQLKVRRDKWMTADYLLRRRLRCKKVAARVAYDWQEKSDRTVSDIASRYRSNVDQMIDRWAQKYPLELYLDAVTDVRKQLLTGAGPEVTKDPDEIIQIVLDWEEALMLPPEIKSPG